jgi:hypothetical protein
MPPRTVEMTALFGFVASTRETQLVALPSCARVGLSSAMQSTFFVNGVALAASCAMNMFIGTSRQPGGGT